MAKLSWTEFLQKIRETAETRYPDKNVDIREIPKNNIILTGMTISNKDKGGIYPTVYLEQSYETYEKTDVEFDVIAEDLFRFYDDCVLENDSSKIMEALMDTLDDYSKAKPLLYPRLIRTVGNEDLINNNVSFPYGNLTILFIIRLNDINLVAASNSQFNANSILVNKQMFENWGISLKELITASLLNLENISDSIIDILLQSTEIAVEDMIEEIPEDVPMTVLSNKERIYGASEMLGVRKKCYIIPSSVHEVICVETDEETDLNETLESTLELVTEVNKTIAPSDVLADAVYYCDGKNMFYYEGDGLKTLPALF